MNGPEKIARLRIALKDVEPEIWRRVEVPLGMNLKSLHDVIQAAFGWQDYHLFEFLVGERRYGIPDPEWNDEREVAQAKLTKLEALVAEGIDGFDYSYDFGDNWEHAIAVEAIIDADPTAKYPRFVDGARRAPPEDVGGFPGYYAFLDAIANKRHPEHKNLLKWHGGPYDPDHFDLFELRLRLGAIAKRRYAGKAAYAKRKSKS
jgi:hypothetical protein